ncbi:MAG: hypothetical protein IJI53_11470 [Clostridia bacterium]|nr:hypothetical protein [Clostridia bacterium]
MSVPGQYTKCDLENLNPLCMPWQEMDGLLQPMFSQDTALLSLELASTAYSMDTVPWQKAGWRDFSYQVDNTLLTGSNVNNENAGLIDEVVSDYYQQLAKMRLNRQNPFSQIMGSLRQRKESDTGKAVVMLHPLLGGQYMVAIGFMGTGKRVYDWFSNFRVTPRESMHEGFLQLSKQFEMNCDAILFPETARELGLEKLTLSDILAECRKPFSRFRVWMAGHSQGGAIMQLFAYFAIQKGLLRQNMLGYSFASPSVVYDHPPCELSTFPLCHIISADDMFPRTGAALHFGRCRVFYPDERMRKRCYGAAWESEAFRAMLAMTRNVTDTGGAFLILLGLLRAMEQMTQEESMLLLNSMVGSLLPEKLLTAVSGRGEDLLRAVRQKVGQGYALATGNEEPPEHVVSALCGRLLGLIKAHGAKAFSKAFISAVALPHKLRGSADENALASYQYIVTERFDELRSKVWYAPASRMEIGVRSKTRHRPEHIHSRFSREINLRARRNNPPRRNI